MNLALMVFCMFECQVTVPLQCRGVNKATLALFGYPVHEGSSSQFQSMELGRIPLCDIQLDDGV